MVVSTLLFFVMAVWGFRLHFRSRHWRSRALTAERTAIAAASESSILRQQLQSHRDAAAEKRYWAQLNDIKNTDNQLRFIGSCELYAVPPVNKEASKVLYALTNWIKSNRKDWRLSFEVGMGAFIRTAKNGDDAVGSAAFSSFNSKRVDFLLVDRFGQPKLVIEYHGSGHHLSPDAPARMEVKRLALSRAGIPLVEIPRHASEADILRLVDRVIAAEHAN